MTFVTPYAPFVHSCAFEQLRLPYIPGLRRYRMSRICAFGLIVSIVALPLISCSSSTTTTPTPTYPSVAGTWSGTLQTASRGTVNITLTLVQQQSVITGTWTSPSDWTGNVTGAVTTQGSFTGVLTISSPNADGSRCTGTGTFGGAFTTSRFSASSPGFSGGCASDVTLLTQKQ
jgi:hypothetical protein